MSRTFQIIRDKEHGLFVEVDTSQILGPGVDIELEYGLEGGGRIRLTLDEAHQLADFLNQQIAAAAGGRA